LTQHGDTRWRIAAAALCAWLTLCASGCHKKIQAPPPLPPIQDPVALVTLPPPEHPPMLEPPDVKMPPVPIASGAARMKRERRKPTTKAAPEPPVQVASAEPPTEATAIGALTSGGEANPRSQQEAADMIAANEKRLTALSAQIVEDQKAQISKVKTFQRQAQEALTSGDAEGAKTLATKAKLLLDDLSK
jgi:ribosomal protein S20